MHSADNLKPISNPIMECRKESTHSRGKLKIFFGYAAGVGKTYAMLDEAQELLKNGVDVLAGYPIAESSPETMQLFRGLPVLPYKVIQKQSTIENEFHLDAALDRKPKLILVDELAHSNKNGVRNRKRYQDIEELLNAGIDVYTTVNVQNLESLNDVVQDITHVYEKETIPDYIFDQADMVVLIDVEPVELLNRLTASSKSGINSNDTYPDGFFTRDSLRLLREVAMRKAADRISHNNQSEIMASEKTANIKLMVCFGNSPSSAKCIRWTARTAEAFHASWVAVYVELPKSENLSPEEKKYYQTNVELAEQLGAEIVTLNGYDVAATVAHYARNTGITNIVIGKSRNKRTMGGMFEVDLEDKLITMLSNIEIHIIPDNSLKTYRSSGKRIIKDSFPISTHDSIKTIAILLFTTIISFGLKRFDVDMQNIVMLYILSILIISRVASGYVYGIIASLASVMIYNYFFTEPYYAFNVVLPGHLFTLFVMLFVALITSALTIKIKNQAETAVDREQRTEVLYEINKKLLVTRGLENIVNLTNEYITMMFGRSTIFYTRDPIAGNPGNIMRTETDDDPDFFMSPAQSSAAHWVFMNQKHAGTGTDTLTETGAYYMPIIFQGNVLGVLGISCKDGLPLELNSRKLLRRIASQVAIALERQRLSDEQRLILVETEKEKMRSNLLRAISHDLRTPLTGILGSSSAILENNDTLDVDTKYKLLSNIKDDSQWLIRMVENLLSVTRINEDTANVTKAPEAAEEIVASAIARIRKRFKSRKINVSVPHELLMVPMDGTLIEQVIINLIENAIKHSGEDSVTDVVLRKENNNAVFEVSDNGEGISQQDFPYLFESYVPNGKRTADSSRGMGIGLSICKTIINAHQGKIEASNKVEGGAVFRFTLPLT